LPLPSAGANWKVTQVAPLLVSNELMFARKRTGRLDDHDSPPSNFATVSVCGLPLLSVHVVLTFSSEAACPVLSTNLPTARPA
jgi:hypothetical protein